MTLKELLLNTHFDDVAACIKKLYSDKESMIPHYKEAFDRLRLIEAIPSEGKIHIVMEEPDWEEPYVRVKGCYELSNEETLGREVLIDEKITNEEAVAHFLWEFTFFGFSEEDIQDEVNGEKKGYTHFMQQAFELKLRYFDGLIYSKQENKRERRKLQTIEDGIGFLNTTWKEIYLHERRCNPIRRKRNYRQLKRITELERKDKVELLIQRLIVNPATSQPFLRDDIDFLFSTSLINEVKFHSYANDKNIRVDYVKELIEKYSSYDFKGYERYLVLVTTAPAHPARPDESLSFISDRFTPGKRVQWGYNYDECLGEEMKILIVMSKFESNGLSSNLFWLSTFNPM